MTLTQPTRFDPSAPVPDAPTVPAPTTAPKPAGKLSFGKIGKAAKASSSGKTYPVFDPNPEQRQLADWLVEHLPLVDAIDTAKKSLVAAVTPFYFLTASGKAEVESSVVIPKNPTVQTSKELAVVFMKKLSKLGEVSKADLLPIINGQVDVLFRETFAIKIDGDKVPAHHAQSLVNDLQELFAKYGCLDALSAKESVAPTPEFFTRRHLDLTPELNEALNARVPIVAFPKIRN